MNRNKCLNCCVLMALTLLTAVTVASAQSSIEGVRKASTATDGYQSKYNTLAHWMLHRESGPSNVTQDMYDFIDAVIDDARARLPRKQKYSRDEAVAVLRTIDDILTSKNVVYPARSMGLVAQLSDGLRGRVMNGAEIQALAAEPHNARRADRIRERASEKFFVNDCDTTSFLYLAIAEILNLPLYLVDLPGHNFIRFDNGAEAFDWETMDALVAPFNYYKKRWRLPDELVENRIYLSSMSKLDVVGYHFTITAEAWATKGVDRRTFDEDLVAATLYPRGPRVWNQLAWHLVTARDPQLRDGVVAMEYAKRAVSISVTPNLLDTLACAHALAGNFVQAKEVEVQAWKLFNTGGYPAEPEVPDFEAQIRRFEQGKTCADPLVDAVVTRARRLSHIVDIK